MGSSQPKHGWAEEAALERLDEEGRVRVLPSGLISRRDFAAYIGRAPKTIAQWDWRGCGPKPVKINGRAFYSFEEVKAFALGEASGDTEVPNVAA
jgi:hypothetical protein